MPSTESISPPPWINMRTGSRYVLLSTDENSGHMIRIFCELNVLLASTRITPSVLSCSNINFIEWIAASAPPCKVVAVCSSTAACWMSLRNTQLIHFPRIRLITSPMPIRIFIELYESTRYKCFKSIMSDQIYIASDILTDG